MGTVRDNPAEPRDEGRSHGHDDWEQHWRSYATSASDNPAQAFRRRIVVHLLREVTPASRILDVGSGTGDLARRLREAYPFTELLGLELSQSGVELSQKKVPDAVFLERDLAIDSHALPTKYRSWATHAACSEVLEHVDEPGVVLTNSIRYMAPGCLLVVTVPGGPMTNYDRHIGHRRHFRPDELRVLLEEAGFEVLRATGAGFPFFNLYRLLMRALGDRLIAAAGATEPSRVERSAKRVFAVLLGANTQLSKCGWQIVAVAQLPSRRDAPRSTSADA